MTGASAEEVTRLHAVLAALGLDVEASVTRLASVSNAVFQVGEGRSGVVVRVACPPRHGADRREEARNARNAAEAGIAPEVVHADVDGGTFVTRLVDGRRVSPEDVRADVDVITAVGHTLQRVHALPGGARRFDPFAVIDGHVTDLTGRHDLARHRAVRRAIGSRATDRDLRLCHNDPWPGNVIVVDGVAVLVDWEYSGLNDPAWDLADFSVEAGLDRRGDDSLLRAYAGADDEAWRVRMEGLKPAVDLLWSLWSLAEFEAGNRADDFVAEAERRLERAEHALGG